jgi:hypothetical protein
MKSMLNVFLNIYFFLCFFFLIIQGGGDSGNAASSGFNESGISTGARSREEV